MQRWLVGLVLACLACGKSSSTPSGMRGANAVVRHLDPAVQGFLAENRARIDALLDERGVGSKTYDPAHRPVAVFDWDNTMMRNDIGDATFFYMLRHDQIRQPPERDWSHTNKHLTTAAKRALNAACDAIAEPNQPLPTSRSTSCADVILSIYDHSTTLDGASAFESETTSTIHQPYAWGAQLQAGLTPDEARELARRAYAENSAAAIDSTQTIGSRSDVVAWVRIYEPMHDLVSSLQANGFDVWVVSASAQYLAEIVGAHVGVDANHVVGVRTMTRADGRLDYRIHGCGTEPDGADTVITYDEGKRCWINRAIFHLPDAEQLSRARDPNMRPVFAAGDSDTDTAMVQDATALKLTINRNRTLLMCNALNDAHARWMIQPMFIEPLPKKKEPYACASALDHSRKPATDEDGHVMIDKSE